MLLARVAAIVAAAGTKIHRLEANNAGPEYRFNL
jgi:hypothetical protein